MGSRREICPECGKRGVSDLKVKSQCGILTATRDCRYCLGHWSYHEWEATKKAEAQEPQR